jgi:hypothetical protein
MSWIVNCVARAVIAGNAAGPRWSVEAAQRGPGQQKKLRTNQGRAWFFLKSQQKGKVVVMKAALLLKKRGSGGMKSPDNRFYLAYENGKFVLSHLLPAGSVVIQSSSSLEELLTWMQAPAQMKKFRFPLAKGNDPFAQW